MERKTNELWRASRRYRVYGLIWRQVVIRNVRCPLELYVLVSFGCLAADILSPCEWHCYIRVIRYLQVSLTSFTDNYKLSRWLENMFSISRHVLYVYWCKSAVRIVRKRRMVFSNCCFSDKRHTWRMFSKDTMSCVKAFSWKISFCP